jgi:cytochrome c oxidase subunit II
MTEQAAEGHERRVLGTELLWAFGVGVLIAAILGMIVFTALTRDINPPSNVELLDPKTLHLSGEFAEQNLGTTVAPDGGVTVRVIATQFMFVPHCIAVHVDGASSCASRRLTSSTGFSLPGPM